jgi:hypothetical protein
LQVVGVDKLNSHRFKRFKKPLVSLKVASSHLKHIFENRLKDGKLSTVAALENLLIWSPAGFGNHFCDGTGGFRKYLELVSVFRKKF